jgi:hypothetical protein
MDDRRLVILASSPRPDVYFNVIAHNAEKGITNFVIATIGDNDESASQKRAADLNRDLTHFVAELQSSRYLKFSTVPGTIGTPLANPAPIDNFFAKVPWGSLTLTFGMLMERDLKTFLRDQHSAGAAFDVTACKNATLAGAVAWIVSRGGSPIHTFESHRQLTFGEADLLPYLEESDFTYQDLSNSVLIRGATRRINVGTVHRRRFWLISAGVAVAVAFLTLLIPPTLANPVLAGAATFATIMSGVALLIRNPDE